MSGIKLHEMPSKNDFEASGNLLSTSTPHQHPDQSPSCPPYQAYASPTQDPESLTTLTTLRTTRDALHLSHAHLLADLAASKEAYSSINTFSHRAARLSFVAESKTRRDELQLRCDHSAADLAAAERAYDHVWHETPRGQKEKMVGVYLDRIGSWIAGTMGVCFFVWLVYRGGKFLGFVRG